MMTDKVPKNIYQVMTITVRHLMMKKVFAASFPTARRTRSRKTNQTIGSKKLIEDKFVLATRKARHRHRPKKYSFKINCNTMFLLTLNGWTLTTLGNNRNRLPAGTWGEHYTTHVWVRVSVGPGGIDSTIKIAHRPV